MPIIFTTLILLFWEFLLLVVPFYFFYLWSYCFENWTVYMNLNLKHILFLFFFFFEIPNVL